jgi:hypothetical protein
MGLDDAHAKQFAEAWVRDNMRYSLAINFKIEVKGELSLYEVIDCCDVFQEIQNEKLVISKMGSKYKVTARLKDGNFTFVLSPSAKFNLDATGEKRLIIESKVPSSDEDRNGTDKSIGPDMGAKPPEPAKR